MSNSKIKSKRKRKCKSKSMARTGMCAKLLSRTLEPKKLAKLPVESKSVPYPSEWSSGRAARGLDHVPP